MAFLHLISRVFLLVGLTIASLSCGHASPCQTVPAAEEDITSAVPCDVEHPHDLELRATVTIPAYKQFVAGEHFIEGSAALQFAWMGSMFRNRFLQMVESGRSERILHVYRAATDAADTQLIAQMRGRVTTSLHDIWVMITRQAHGEPGPLSTKARPNIFYIRDAVGNRWAVDVIWNGAGWEIEASGIDSFIRARGSRVISR